MPPMCSQPEYGSESTPERDYVPGNSTPGWWADFQSSEEPLIDESSPFRRIPFELDPHQAFFLAGIRWTIEMLNLHYRRLLVELSRLSAGASKSIESDGIQALADAWSLVDSLHRFRELVQQVPNLKHSPEQELFVRKTSSINELRDSIQHLREGILNMASNSQPVWGVLSWMALQDLQGKAIWACALQAGGKLDGRQLSPIPVAGTMTAPIDRVTLTHAGHTAELSDAGRRARALFKGLERGLAQALESQNPSGPHQGSMQFLQLDIRPDWSRKTEGDLA